MKKKKIIITKENKYNMGPLKKSNMASLRKWGTGQDIALDTVVK